MRLIPVLLLPLCLTSGNIPVAQAERLAVASDCELALERQASVLIFDLNLELEKHNSLSSREFDRIRKSLQALKAHGNSPKALSCFRQNPFQKDRYQSWLRLQSHKVVTETNQRLDQVCARQTRIFITTKKLHIDAAVRTNRLAKAAKLAAAMQKELQANTMMSHCPITRRSVEDLLRHYIPEVQNQAALPKVSADLSLSYHNAKGMLDDALAVLETGSSAMKSIPHQLGQASGAASLKQELKQCLLYSGILSDLGANTGATLDENVANSPTLLDVKRYCEKYSQVQSTLTHKFSEHNAQYEKLSLKRWHRSSIKGWGMEKVYTNKGRPIAESAHQNVLLWVYLAESNSQNSDECTTFRFSKRGKLLGNRNSACPK